MIDRDEAAIDALIRECGGITPLEHARQRAADALERSAPLVRQIARNLGVPPWSVAAMACAVCGKEWVATYPTEATALECPDCGHMNPAPEAGE